MADEIAQVCQMEIQGVTFVVKGTVQTAAFLGKALRALILWSMEKHFERAGERSVKDIFKMSEGGPAQVSDVPNECLADVLKEMERLNLHHAVIIDNDITDGMTPILIPYQEAALVSEIVKNILLKNTAAQKNNMVQIDKDLAENMEKLLNCSAEEKPFLETKIENYEQCRDEIHKVIDRNEDIIQNGSTVSFIEYLSSFKDTGFEKNPDMAITELKQGAEIGKSFPAKECMQPIRDPELVPETNCYYYLPERGVSITREFKIDKETRLVFSNYSLKTGAGEMFEFSDQNKTKAEWSETDLPSLMGKADILEGTMCRIFTYEERMLAYEKIHGNVKSEAELRVEERQKSGKEVFSSADASREIQHAVSEQMKGMASAKIENDELVITVTVNNAIMENGKLKINVDDKTTALFSNIKPGAVKDGTLSFSIKKSESVQVGVTDSKTENINYSKYSAEGIKRLIDDKQNTVVNELSRGTSR